jgi:HEAT repeat protein
MPNPTPRQPNRSETAPEDAPSTPQGRAVAAWLQQLSRTLKTCRLYDAGNPTVVGFRRDLIGSLDELLATHGALQVGFDAQQISLGEVPVYVARSREDNLALPFLRDGIRRLSIQPGVAPREVEAVVDALLKVMSRANEDLDLVTLLWESELEHVSIEYVSTDADVEAGGGLEADLGSSANVAPWPRREAGGAIPLPSGEVSAPGASAATRDLGRSDDRFTAGISPNLETAALDLQFAADSEIERLRQECERHTTLPAARAALDLMDTCMKSGATDADRADLSRFLPRVLHEAVAAGAWAEAREGLTLMRGCGLPEDPAITFAKELEQPQSVTSEHAWTHLDHEGTEQHDAFFAFARELGPDAADWLMQGLARSQRQGFRRALAREIAVLVAGNPERLAPWLADERWYVVRNVVHVFGMIGGESTLGMLRAASRHPEYRVRREVVAALTRVPAAAARPVLLEMLEAADTRLFGTILRHLATGPDPDLAGRLLRQTEDPRFDSRPEEETRAVYHALGATADDSVLPALEARIQQGNWFQRGKDEGRLAAALCVARIGTPAARALLERGAASRRAEVARACASALAGFRPKAGGESRE